MGGMKILGSSMTGKKTETRLFQTSPDTKEYLTKEQAENPPVGDDGKPIRPRFYWRDEPVQIEPDGQRRNN